MKDDEQIRKEAMECEDAAIQFMLFHFQLSIGFTDDPTRLLDLYLHIKIYREVMDARRFAV